MVIWSVVSSRYGFGCRIYTTYYLEGYIWTPTGSVNSWRYSTQYTLISPFILPYVNRPQLCLLIPSRWIVIYNKPYSTFSTSTSLQLLHSYLLLVAYSSIQRFIGVQMPTMAQTLIKTNTTRLRDRLRDCIVDIQITKYKFTTMRTWCRIVG